MRLLTLVLFLAGAVAQQVTDKMSSSNAKIERDVLAKGIFYSPTTKKCMYAELKMNSYRNLRIQIDRTAYYYTQSCQKNCNSNNCETRSATYTDFVNKMRDFTYLGKFRFIKPHTQTLRAYRGGVLPLSDYQSKKKSAIIWLNDSGDIKAMDFIDWTNGFDRIWFNDIRYDGSNTNCQSTNPPVVSCTEELKERWYDPDLDLTGQGTFLMKMKTTPVLEFWSTWFQDKPRKLLRIDIGNPKDYGTNKYAQSFYMNETGGYMLENNKGCHWSAKDLYDKEIKAYSYNSFKWLGKCEVLDLRTVPNNKIINIYAGWAPDVALPDPGYQVLLYLQDPGNNYVGMEILNDDPNDWRRYGFTSATLDRPKKTDMVVNDKCKAVAWARDKEATVLDDMSRSNANFDRNVLATGKFYSPTDKKCKYAELRVNKDTRKMRLQIDDTAYYFDKNGCQKDCKASCNRNTKFEEFRSKARAFTYLGKFKFDKPHQLTLRAYRGGLLPVDDYEKDKKAALIWIDDSGNIRALDFIDWKNGFDRIWFDKFQDDDSDFDCKSSQVKTVSCTEELKERSYDPDLDLTGDGKFLMKLKNSPAVMEFWSSWFQDKPRKLLRIDIGNPKDYGTNKYAQSFYMNETGGYMLQNGKGCHWSSKDLYDKEVQAYSYKSFKWLGRCRVEDLRSVPSGKTINIYMGWAPDVALPDPGYQVLLYLVDPGNNYLGMEILNETPGDWRRYGFTEATLDRPSPSDMVVDSRCGKEIKFWDGSKNTGIMKRMDFTMYSIVFVSIVMSFK